MCRERLCNVICEINAEMLRILVYPLEIRAKTGGDSAPKNAVEDVPLWAEADVANEYESDTASDSE